MLMDCFMLDLCHGFLICYGYIETNTLLQPQLSWLYYSLGWFHFPASLTEVIPLVLHSEHQLAIHICTHTDTHKYVVYKQILGSSQLIVCVHDTISMST